MDLVDWPFSRKIPLDVIVSVPSSLLVNETIAQREEFLHPQAHYMSLFILIFSLATTEEALQVAEGHLQRRTDVLPKQQMQER